MSSDVSYSGLDSSNIASIDPTPNTDRGAAEPLAVGERTEQDPATPGEATAEASGNDSSHATTDQILTAEGPSSDPAATGGDPTEGAQESADLIEPLTDVRFTGTVDGFSEQASACLNKAAKLAVDLNHTCISADHLMLALTLEPRTQKWLERVGDAKQLRQSAMQKIANMHWRYSEAPVSSNGFQPALTADLLDIFTKARQQADERGQDVSIIDLVDAFPTDDARYQVLDVDSVPAMIERIEKSLTPRLNEFLSSLEGQVRDMTQKNVELVLQDFASKVRARLEAMAPPYSPSPPEPFPRRPAPPQGFWDRTLGRT